MPRHDCADCGAPLTAAERCYYGASCERCEGAAWRAQQEAELAELKPDRCPWDDWRPPRDIA